MEKLVSEDITNMTDETFKAVKEGIGRLHVLLMQPSILNFMRRYLRFPNMKINIIGLENAKTKRERNKILSFMKDLGIPTPDQKSQTLKNWIQIWQGLQGMSESDIQ